MNKVLLAAPLPPPIGGIASWAVSMIGSDFGSDWKIEGFKSNSENSTVYAHLDPKRNLWQEIKRCFRIWKGISRRLKEDKDIKIVHVNIPANFTSMLRECITARVVRARKRKMIVHFHCTLPQIVLSRKQLFIFKRLMKYSQNAFVLNQQSYDYIKNNTNANVYLIPNFVNDSFVRKTNKQINPKIKTALYVGGIIDKKGCRIIIETAKSFPDIQFRMVGYISEEYKDIVLPDNVIMTGEQRGQALKNEFENADVFLFLSFMKNEGFSIALTEAMAYGLPCIAADWAANKDMIGEEGGIIVPVHSSEAVVSAIKKMDIDSEFREKASLRNVKTVSDLYSQKTVSKILAKAYSDVLSR